MARRESLLYFRIHKDIYERFKTAAMAQGMTISSLGRKLVGDYLKWWETGGEETILADAEDDKQAEAQL